MKKIFFTLLFLYCCAISAQTKLEIKPLKNKTYFDISGGLSSRLGKVVKTNDAFFDKKLLASTKGFFIDASIFFQAKPNSNHFLGMKYNTFINYLNNNKLAISFYGISYLYSKELEAKDLLNFDLSLGYIAYKDNQYFIDNYVIKGGNVGVKANFYYLVKIANGVFSGPKIGLQLGSAKEFEAKNINGGIQTIKIKDINESLSNLDLGIVFRISL